MKPQGLTKGRYHKIEEDIAGNLGIAWIVDFCRLSRFNQWRSVWS